MERMKLRKVTNGTSTKEKSAVPFYNFFIKIIDLLCVCMHVGGYTHKGK